MVTITGIHKAFGRQDLFEDASLQINSEDRYALVGPNGSGKSTLFKMILRDDEPDGGEIRLKKGVSVGYLPQQQAVHSGKSVLEEALVPSVDDPTDAEPDPRLEAKAKAVLMGLGFIEKDFARCVGELSAGWAMRVAIARLLLQEPDLLLLDEPTNHLDLDSLLWFRDYLKEYPGAIFLVSHDRAFINSVCGAIVSVQDLSLKVYHGDYEAFVAEREAERRRLEAAYQRQQAEIAHMQDFIDRNRVRASTASRAQSMIKRLEKLERIELPQESKTVKIRFPQPTRAGVRVLQLKDIHKSYGELKVYEGLDFELERGWKMAFVGHNGAGKSTLIKLLSGVLDHESGERKVGMNVKVGYFSQERTESLDPRRTVLQEALDNDRMNPEQMVRTVLGTFLFPGDAVFKKVAVLSGGEKSRLALVKLLLDPPNVLLMDEPTTHLDMPSVEALISALKEFEGTLCFISHDLYFINSLANHVVHVNHGKITVFPGNYEYFQRRQRQKLAETPAPARPAKGGAKGDSRKETRLKRSEERKRGKRVERLRKELEKGGARLEELAERLADPEIYGDYAKVQAIGDEMKSLQDDLAAKKAELDELDA